MTRLGHPRRDDSSLEALRSYTTSRDLTPSIARSALMGAGGHNSSASATRGSRSERGVDRPPAARLASISSGSHSPEERSVVGTRSPMKDRSTPADRLKTFVCCPERASAEGGFQAPARRADCVAGRSGRRDRHARWSVARQKEQAGFDRVAAAEGARAHSQRGTAETDMRCGSRLERAGRFEECSGSPRRCGAPRGLRVLGASAAGACAPHRPGADQRDAQAGSTRRSALLERISGSASSTSRMIVRSGRTTSIVVGTTVDVRLALAWSAGVSPPRKGRWEGGLGGALGLRTDAGLCGV